MQPLVSNLNRSSDTLRKGVSTLHPGRSFRFATFDKKTNEFFKADINLYLRYN